MFLLIVFLQIYLFQPQYLLRQFFYKAYYTLSEILTNLDSTEVVIQLADPSRAGIIVPAEQPENEDVLMLIMPMLLND